MTIPNKSFKLIKRYPGIFNIDIGDIATSYFYINEDHYIRIAYRVVNNKGITTLSQEDVSYKEYWKKIK